MSLEVFVGNAVNVPNIEKVGKSDPYCTVEFLGVKKKTQVQKQNLNPVWNEQLVFTLADKPLSSSDKIDVYVKDWERVGRNR
ncbi:PREDICTED: dysferlin-like [Priapulus caudatus]|uniref:Dysferlin-like n=1 Tax=Priapulus caudatus TaxID=37621 RepID=A0ABM1EGT8_PRICU|nr:PREDICTED: dysferlin-like [Priapulus caudatus]XP_014671411.1 PREDICTED: dysferlin-like [Priapulus caudatus]XP_014671412.1 PREDICTED: dysferlin-like [Priapulus caudatus]XP_014671413.1 PREDICTED: dysferlin-like [Priapulus caudatus]